MFELLLYILLLVALTCRAGCFYVEWHLTVGQLNADGSFRHVLLINNQFQPSLTVEQGDTMMVNVFNDLPLSYAAPHPGVSIHWHGFSQRGTPYMDGVAFGTQCPIPAGTNFTYSFVVLDPPGTYFWHAHNDVMRADGLAGMLIVLPQPGTRSLFSPAPAAEIPLFLTDWFYNTSGSQTAGLDRPLDAAKGSRLSGSFQWVSLPNSILIGGQGCVADCPVPALGPTLGQAPNDTLCDPVGSEMKGLCNHSRIQVTANQTYLLRIVNSASLLMLTVCVDAHKLVLVAADAQPIQPLSADCVDVNSGQRYDALLTTSQTPGSSFWISILPQYRRGAPAGYAILQYASETPQLPSTTSVPSSSVQSEASSPKGSLGASQAAEVSAPGGVLPVNPPLQPGQVAPWTLQQLSAVQMNSALSGDEVLAAVYGYTEPLGPPPSPTTTLHINTAQPLLKSSGQLRWALNNVVGLQTDFCRPAITTIVTEPGWLKGTPSGLLNQVTPKVYTDDAATQNQQQLSKPVLGIHIFNVSFGSVVDIVIQNNPAGSFGGEYRPGVSRMSEEQHPFHLHGYKFWVMGSGSGVYDPVQSPSTFNTANPPLRDTSTLYPNSWLAIRFVADNPGVWLLHCHIIYHAYMGQSMYVVVDAPNIPPPPPNMPSCRYPCSQDLSLLPLSVNTDLPTDLSGILPGYVYGNGSVRHCVGTFVSLLLAMAVTLVVILTF